MYGYDNTSAARRNRVEGDWSGTARTRFDLQFDARGFLHTAKQSGTAFQDYYAGTSYSSVYNYYVYDNRGQLKTAIMYRGVPPSNINTAPLSSDELPGRRFNYGYDGSGNRTETGPVDPADTGNAAYGLDEAFSPNSLNQYDSRENKVVHVLGTVTSGASMSASSSGTTGGSIAFTMLDRSFSADAVPANSGGVVKGTMSLTATLSGSTQSASRDWLAAPATQTFSYDADGNLTGDGVWQYTYDGENRLTQMDSQLPTGQGYTRLRLVFKYDYLGRRIQKTVTNLDTSATTFSRRFLYDGWNLIAELDSTNGSIQRSYTWGLDVAGTFTATGGVGALLQITDWTTNTTYLPTYDGNGNVSSLINAADGAVVATYEYSPFGELLRRQEPASGGYAKLNPFRFSTKYTDEETGLVYYGRRYYSPSLGRFINRDPIGEAGGVNLYAMCGNNAATRFDVLGNGWWQSIKDTVTGWFTGGTSSAFNNDPDTGYTGKEFQQHPDNSWAGDPVVGPRFTVISSRLPADATDPSDPPETGAQAAAYEKRLSDQADANNAYDPNSIVASVWRPVPDQKPWFYRHDTSAGGDDPPHTHYKKRDQEYARRVYKDGSQSHHGDGVDKDVPEDVIDATPPNKYPDPVPPKAPDPSGNKNAFEEFLMHAFGSIARTTGPAIMPVPPERYVTTAVVGGALTVTVLQPELAVPIVAGAAASAGQ